MKNANILNAIFSIVVVAGAIMSIMHVSGSYYVQILGLLGIVGTQQWQIKKLNTELRKSSEQ